MEFYNNSGRVLQWFGAELSEHMELYAEPSAGLYVLVEKYHCDIITTSRVYTNTCDGKESVLPPNAWNNPIVGWKVNRHLTTHFMNGRNTYTFSTFDDFLTYVKILHATRDTIPFFRYKQELTTEHLAKLVDADSVPPAPKRVRREKIYISA